MGFLWLVMLKSNDFISSLKYRLFILQVIEVLVFFLYVRMQAQDLDRVFQPLHTREDCAKWAAIAMLADHFLAAANVGNTAFWAGYKHHKK
jgi:hypothetical protein